MVTFTSNVVCKKNSCGNIYYNFKGHFLVYLTPDLVTLVTKKLVNQYIFSSMN